MQGIPAVFNGWNAFFGDWAREHCKARLLPDRTAKAVARAVQAML
jgi:hypothetical protein